MSQKILCFYRCGLDGAVAAALLEDEWGEGVEAIPLYPNESLAPYISDSERFVFVGIMPSLHDLRLIDEDGIKTLIISTETQDFSTWQAFIDATLRDIEFTKMKYHNITLVYDPRESTVTSLTQKILKKTAVSPIVEFIEARATQKR